MTAESVAAEIIKQFEGCKLQAYPDPESADGKPVTIGYGSTGAGIELGTVWTQEQADNALLARITQLKNQIDNLSQVELSDNQMGALCCLTYNIGIGNFKESTLLKELNACNAQAAADQFLVWNKSGGHVVEGLTRRREAERNLFLKG